MAMIIKIKNFRLETILGIYDHEQDVLRPVVINAEIYTNFDGARFSNAIEDTIDYDDIIAKIKKLVLSKKFALIEKMAQEILDLIMEDLRVDRCVLELDKVGIVDGVESFSITLSEERNG